MKVRGTVRVVGSLRPLLNNGKVRHGKVRYACGTIWDGNVDITMEHSWPIPAPYVPGTILMVKFGTVLFRVFFQTTEGRTLRFHLGLAWLHGVAAARSVGRS